MNRRSGDEETLVGALVAHAGDLEHGVEAAGIFAGYCQRTAKDVGCSAASGAEGALAAFLADANEFERGGADCGQGLVVVGGERGRQRHAFYFGLERADHEGGAR